MLQKILPESWGQTKEWKEIFANNISNKDFIFTIGGELLK